jgi:hypothetical protein
MPFNVQEFKSVISVRQGILPKNKFVFTFTQPLSINHPLNKRAVLQKDLSFYCDSVNVPGRNVNTSSHRRYGVGWTESNVIYGGINQLQATFIADSQGETLSLFDEWIHYIIGSESWVLNSTDMFAVPYRDDIITNADIHIYRDDGKPSKTYELFEVYPIAILDHQLSWADDNQIMTFVVVFDVFAVRSFEYGPNSLPVQTYNNDFVTPFPSRSEAQPVPKKPLSIETDLNNPPRRTAPLQFTSPDYNTDPNRIVKPGLSLSN